MVTRSGRSRGDEIDRFLPVGRHTHDLDLVITGEDLHEHLARERRVVGHEHTYGASRHEHPSWSRLADEAFDGVQQACPG
jgi:hypothetical protein